MMPVAPRSTVVTSAVLALALTGSVVTAIRLEQVRPAAALEEVLYLPSSKAIKRLSLGYSSLVATIYWTRAVQYFGRKHIAKAEHYDMLYPLLDITTDLDPKIAVAYEFGAIFLSQKPPHGAGQFEKALALAEKGIRNNPDNWRLYYSLGFLHYDQKDYKNAAEAFRRGSEAPGAHPWLKNLAAVMAERGGDTRTARFMWSRVYESTEDKQIKANAARRLMSLVVDEEVPQLEELVRRFSAATGRVPATFREMAQQGWIRQAPVDPAGNPYLIERDGRVVVQDPDALPFIEKGIREANPSKASAAESK